MPLNRIYQVTVEFASSILFCYFITVCMGAQLIGQFHGTLLFSMIISSLAIMPSLIYVEHENPFTVVERLLILKSHKNFFEHVLIWVSHGSIVGAWCSAFVIPLDWDRWWQAWPIPCCFGAIFGAFIGLLISFFQNKSNTKSKV
jgi:phosphatidylinositol glycan class F